MPAAKTLVICKSVRNLFEEEYVRYAAAAGQKNVSYWMLPVGSVGRTLPEALTSETFL